MASPAEYKLSSVLYGHSVDVRGLACTADGLVVSASRDKTAKLWKVDGVKPEPTHTYKGQANYVSCVCVLPPSPHHPEGAILTGSNDHSIFAFSLVSGEVLYRLTEHQNAVCCLWACSDGRVLSSSWDSTARVWLGQNQTAVLQGHQASVWGVTELQGSSKVITASADKTIKLWSGQDCELTITGHEDVVRSVASVSCTEFLSCSNDATVRMWQVTGECLGVYYGHTNYIYSISCLPGGGFVTGGEDQAVLVWRANGEVEQSIKMPVQSVWAVVALPNGDIAAGSSDGAVRVFSRDPARQAGEDSLTTFEQEVSSFGSTTKEEIGGFKVNDLPGPEVLMTPGRNDGQTTMVREDGKVFCYGWSQAELQWKKIGEAVGAPPPAEGKTSFQGKDYDFVFSVDIQEGMPPLKLPYNKGEDPWVVAQKFIHDNDLSQMFLDTIANFVIQNSGGNAAPAPSASSTYVDPFTGGSRYVPSGAGSSSTSATAVNPDPFTGDSSYTSVASPPRPQVSDVPVIREYHLFQQTSLDKLAVKLKQYNAESPQPMSEDEVNEVIHLADVNYPASDATISLLQKMIALTVNEQGVLTNNECLFVVLDLVRLAVRNPHVNEALCSGNFSTLLMSNVLRPNLTNKAPELNRLMALRVAVNMLAHPHGEKFAMDNVQFLMIIASELSLPNAEASPRQQVALATMIFNLSVASLRGYTQLSKSILPLASLILPRLSDAEAQMRCLRALNNLLDQADSALLAVAKEKKLPEALQALIGEANLSVYVSHLNSILARMS